MNSTLKLWTQLGLGTALAGGLLAACGGEAGGEGATGEAGAPGAAATAGEGEGEGGAGEGEAAAMGGEGEGGVAVADAAKDPVAYGIALAVAEAHVVAARDAYAAGKKENRFCLPNTRFLLHEPRGGVGGSASDVEIQAREILRMRERLNQIFADATRHGPPAARH
jgi:hypothetical protein